MNKAIRALVTAARDAVHSAGKMYLSILKGFIPTYLYMHAHENAATTIPETTICVYL